MSQALGIMLLAMLAAGLAALLWWLIIVSEGVYLGRRAVIQLYDLYADRYDDIKRYLPDYEHWLLAEPILAAVAPHHSPLVLDVATGTGRLPLALVSHSQFHGRVVAVDLSRRMLHLAAQKLQGYEPRVSLIWGPAERLPFDEETFDVVTCLESLEFMVSPKVVLEELLRVVRPGGILLVTNRINTRLMPGKTWTDEQVAALLKELGVERVEIEPWQLDYHKVWALKAGHSLPTGARPLDEILRCPRCRDSLMAREGQVWVCKACSGVARIGEDGVIELRA